MLVDVRSYRCRPGTINAHLTLYEEYGLVPQYRCLGTPLAFLRGESGDPNEYVHIWVYENAGDREAKRAKLWSDPDWLAYVQKSAELGALERQKNKLMVPTSFCPDLTTG
ncbi:MAG: NIPSNAP family protein [Candidatus Puniceispirillaceae bacterium]